MKKPSKLITLLLALLLIYGAVSFFTGGNTDAVLDTAADITANAAESAVPAPEEKAPAATDGDNTQTIDEHGTYTSKEDVALYIHTYGRLPENFVTKKEAEAAGWSGGSVEKYLPGKCIGGSSFGNKEGLLPDKEGRRWTECDINTLGKSSRGAERIVFSNDGLIFYTGDHYESFEQLY